MGRGVCRCSGGSTRQRSALFAFVNYTTLGYGDITPVREWRLIGPLTAMNGVLLFGWSAAILFEVLRKTLEHLGMTEVANDLERTNGVRRGLV